MFLVDLVNPTALGTRQTPQASAAPLRLDFTKPIVNAAILPGIPCSLLSP